VAGDTLYSIARTYGLTTDALKRANNLKSERLILGQTLRLTEASAAAKPAEKNQEKTAETYTVRKGDTLSGIADRFNVPVAELKKRNKLGPALRPGQKLVIR
jgi:LysM repeat protein